MSEIDKSTIFLIKNTILDILNAYWYEKRTILTKPNHNQFCPAVTPHVSPGRICIKPLAEDELISEYIRQSGCWEGDIVSSVLLAMIHFPTATFLGSLRF